MIQQTPIKQGLSTIYAWGGAHFTGFLTYWILFVCRFLIPGMFSYSQFLNELLVSVLVNVLVTWRQDTSNQRTYLSLFIIILDATPNMESMLQNACSLFNLFF